MSQSDVFHLASPKTIYKGLSWQLFPATRSA
ncbi:Uncharacterised protein [Serratia rubidaea]|uniref:Uncharacterized protein n=1 Tax=Serratia rubidaea TaxID=61652 RepID=A0A4U9H865_SERRU|nr:Uncharacterised protein [Serratia rubidaea]